MNQNFPRTITKENLEITIELINLEKNLTEEEKFNILMRNCEINLAKIIIGKKLNTGNFKTPFSEIQLQGMTS
jgi:hypothetical protein